MGVKTHSAKIPPEKDQIEVTLLGPGYGESVLIHLGHGKWVIVDSCIDSETSEPAALSYLQSIGVEFKQSVVLIIATHWHDDHVRGISKILSLCPNATFCTSSAFTKEEFLDYVISFDEHNMIAADSGTSEFSKMLHILGTRSPTKALMNRRIYHVPAGESGHGKECSVWTLSPSDKQVDGFLASMASLIPEARTTKCRAVEPADIKNNLSIVTLIQVGGLSVLLGGDLKETKDSETGWSVIIESTERPQEKASIYKIPHHGSSNAHNDEVWNKLLLTQPHAILTPFDRGKKKLPSPEDIARIESLTENGYSTARIASVKTAIRRPSAVEKTIKETVGKIRRIQPRTGMVRLRRTIGSSVSWSVELSGPACRLADVHMSA